jgi:hypothetical protein
MILFEDIVVGSAIVRIGNVGPPLNQPSRINPTDFTRAIFAGFFTQYYLFCAQTHTNTVVAAKQHNVLPSPFFVELTPLCVVANVLVTTACDVASPPPLVHLSHPGEFVESRVSINRAKSLCVCVCR